MNKQKLLGGLSLKILKINVLAMILAVTLTSGYAMWSLKNTVQSLSQNQVQTSVSMFADALEQLETQFFATWSSFILQDQVSLAIEQNSPFILASHLEKQSRQLGVEKALITNLRGEVFVNYVAHKGTYDLPLSTEASSKAELVLNQERLAYEVHLPITGEGNAVVGWLHAALPLDQPLLVDRLKERSGDEYTLFAGDLRINTTLLNEGGRAVGTRLDAAVAQQVLEQKVPYHGSATLFGRPYITTYVPLYGQDSSQPLGILYAGMDMTDIQRTFLNNLCIIAALALLTLTLSLIFTGSALNRLLRRPLEKVVHGADAVARGRVSDHLLADLALIQSKDEMEDLARSMASAVLSIQTLIHDAQKIKDAFDGKDLRIQLSLDRHQGAYQELLSTYLQLFEATKSLLSYIQSISQHVDLGSKQVSQASQSLAQGATEQASSTEELMATLEEVGTQVQNNAQNTTKATTLSEEAQSQVYAAAGQMENMLVAMKDIENNSKEIGKIIHSIDDIAFQTNILALNAAVEAARAGSAGKGFAVVADEVRNLAKKSAEAASLTTDLIRSALASIHNGSQEAVSTKSAIEGVILKTREINRIIGEIETSVQQENQAILQVNQGIEQIADVVHTNSATAEETAASSEELASQVQALQDLISQYRF